MALATEPDTYCPNIDEHGNYADRIPSFNTAALANGLRCSCGTRKDKVYASAAMFASHIKTKTHEKWLQDLNANKANFYIENKKLSQDRVGILQHRMQSLHYFDNMNLFISEMESLPIGHLVHLLSEVTES